MLAVQIYFFLEKNQAKRNMLQKLYLYLKHIMPLFFDRMSNPLTAVITSVTAVLILREVVSQAFCTRYSLVIDAVLSSLVYFLIFITFIFHRELQIVDVVLGKYLIFVSSVQCQ